MEGFVYNHVKRTNDLNNNPKWFWRCVWLKQHNSLWHMWNKETIIKSFNEKKDDRTLQ